MDYHLKINEDTMTVTVSEDKDGMRFVIGDCVYTVKHTRLGGNHLHLNVNDLGTHAFVLKNGSGKTIMIDGVAHEVADEDLQALNGGRKKKSGHIPDAVTPPMPSVVIAVLVKPGDRVVKGQGLVVLSAMKMETTLSAPFGGVVTDIHTNEGEKVAPGDILVNIAKDTPETEKGDSTDE